MTREVLGHLTTGQEQLRVAERQRAVAGMYLTGHTQCDIARRQGVGQSTISRDLAAVREQWRKAAVRDMNELMNVELSKLDAVEAEYWRAWRRSQGRCRRVTGPGGGQPNASGLGDDVLPDDGGEVPGNPAFLAGVERCIERRCRLLGLAAPEKVAVVAPVKLIAGVDLDAV